MATDGLFSERLAKYLSEAVADLAGPGTTRVRLNTGDPPACPAFPAYPDEPERGFAGAELTVTKVSAWVPCSDEAAMDAGLIPDTRPRPGWRWRLRWKAARWREQAARRAYRVVAGEWPHEPDPYDGWGR